MDRFKCYDTMFLGLLNKCWLFKKKEYWQERLNISPVYVILIVLPLENIQEEFTCERELSNYHNNYAIKVVKEGETVGNTYHNYSQKLVILFCYLTTMKVCVTEKPENQKESDWKFLAL